MQLETRDGVGAWSGVGGVGRGWGCGMGLDDTGWGWWLRTGTVWVRAGGVGGEWHGAGEVVWDVGAVFAPPRSG